MARRTQQERREATVAKLIQATIDAIAEVGYVRTTVNQICERAGVSHGGLFRHFPTREDLVVAAADEVGRRVLAQARQQLADVTVDNPAAMTAALRIMRDSSRSPINAVLVELLLNCRTDTQLADKIRPMAASYYDAIYQLASEVCGIDSDPDRVFETAVFGVMSFFDGETMATPLYADTDLEERRLHWLSGVAWTTLQSLRKD